MGTIFFKVIEMSIAAVLLMITVALIRIPLKRAPKWFMGLLWTIVALRLLIPVQITAHVGFLPDFGNVIENFFEEQEAGDNENVVDLETAPVAVSGGIYDAMDITGGEKDITSEVENTTVVEDSAVLATEEAGEAVTAQGIPTFLVVVWVVGMVLVLAYAVISFIRIKIKTSASIRYISGERVYVCDEIDTPFIFGVFKPAIYMPSGLSERTIKNVLAHEKAHLQRYDHIRKQFGFLILAIHWFNPLVWVSYMLFCRDIELACDERVIRNMNLRQKRSYAESLLTCSTQRRLVLAYPLAFGEVGVGTRVKQIFNYKQPTTWLVTMIVLVCGVLSTCAFTKAADKPKVEPFPLETLKEIEAVADETIKTEVNVPVQKELKEINEEFNSGIFDQENKVGIETTKENGAVNLPYVENTERAAESLPHGNEEEVVVQVNEGNETVNVGVSGDNVNVSVKDGNENVNVNVNKNDPVVKEVLDLSGDIIKDLDNVVPGSEIVDEVVDDVIDEAVDEIMDEVVDEVFDEFIDEGINIFKLFP